MRSEHELRILFLESNPEATSRLDLEDEFRDLGNVLRAIRFREGVQLILGPAVRPDDLVRLLRQEVPTVVHFSGHGSPDGIILRTDRGGHVAVPGEALERLFRDRGVSVVVLNACFSQNQALSLSSVVPAVVGTSAAVGDEAARRFTTAFYRTLGNGYSVKEAFKDGRDAVAIHTLEDVFIAYGDLDIVLFGPRLREPGSDDFALMPRPGNWPIYHDGNYTPNGKFAIELEFHLIVGPSDVELIELKSVCYSNGRGCLHREPLLKVGEILHRFHGDWRRLSEPIRLASGHTYRILYTRQLRPPRETDIPIDIETGCVEFTLRYRRGTELSPLDYNSVYRIVSGNLYAQRQPCAKTAGITDEGLPHSEAG